MFFSSVVLLCAMSESAHAQIFVSNVFGTPQTINGSIGEYNLDGSAVNSALIPSGLAGPVDIVTSGASLFVVNSGGEFIGSIDQFTTSGTPVNTPLLQFMFPRSAAVFGSTLYVVKAGTVGVFTTAGGTVNSSLVSGLTSPYGIAISGDGTHLFVADFDDDVIGEYDAATGGAVNAALITGLSTPTGIAISGSHLFVANSGSGTIGEYNLDGTPVNTALISGLSNPMDLAVFGSDLFVVNNGTNSVGEYDATTGSAINAALITGLTNPQSIAIVPEPAMLILGALGLVGVAVICKMTRFLRRQEHPDGSVQRR
jgi:DNA-binding beta-propeller fold protein YncE